MLPSDRFICFILTMKRRWRLVFWRRQLKRSSTFFEEKCIRVTWLDDFLTSKWPGSFTSYAGAATVMTTRRTEISTMHRIAQRDKRDIRLWIYASAYHWLYFDWRLFSSEFLDTVHLYCTQSVAAQALAGIYSQA